jgi:hypothetical protein
VSLFTPAFDLVCVCLESHARLLESLSKLIGPKKQTGRQATTSALRQHHATMPPVARQHTVTPVEKSAGIPIRARLHNNSPDCDPHSIRHRDAGHARASAIWKTSASTLPPVARTQTVLPAMSILPDRTAARAATPPGSTTILRWRQAAIIASSASSSEIAAPPVSWVELRAQVRAPGVGVMIASQIEPVRRSLVSRRPLASDRL